MLLVIVVIGLNGKMMIKEMIVVIFKVVFGDVVLVICGNFDNEIGLLFMLFGLNVIYCVVVIEMGMNWFGEIVYLIVICVLIVVLVINVQCVYFEGMGDLDEVVWEKGSIFDGLQVNGVVVINVDDGYVDFWCVMVELYMVCNFVIDYVVDVYVKVCQ